MAAWVRRKDTENLLRLAPYQEAPSPPMTLELYAACERAVHVRTLDGRTLRAGKATLFVLEHIGWGPLARLLALPPFVWLVELAYLVISKNRGVFGRYFFRNEPEGP